MRQETRTRRAMRSAIVALALCATPRALAMGASNTYSCTAYCSSTASACGAGNFTNATNSCAANAAYEGCASAACVDACAQVDVSASGAANVTRGSTTYTCFNATKTMWMSQALAIQQSVALNCGPGAHQMSSMWMQGSNMAACGHGTTTTSAASTDERAMAFVIATVLAMVGNAALA